MAQGRSNRAITDRLFLSPKAAKRGPGPLRGWMLAAALVNCCDALTMAKSTSARPAAHALAAVVSGLSASAELLLAQQLAR